MVFGSITFIELGFVLKDIAATLKRAKCLALEDWWLQGCRVSGFGCQVSGSGFRVSGFGFRVQGSGFRVSDFRCRVSGFGFRVSGIGSRVSGIGFRIHVAVTKLLRVR